MKNLSLSCIIIYLFVAAQLHGSFVRWMYICIMILCIVFNMATCVRVCARARARVCVLARGLWLYTYEPSWPLITSVTSSTCVWCGQEIHCRAWACWSKCEGVNLHSARCTELEKKKKKCYPQSMWEAASRESHLESEYIGHIQRQATQLKEYCQTSLRLLERSKRDASSLLLNREENRRLRQYFQKCQAGNSILTGVWPSTAKTMGQRKECLPHQFGQPLRPGWITPIQQRQDMHGVLVNEPHPPTDLKGCCYTLLHNT